MINLAIDLSFQPVGGSLQQVREVIKDLNLYTFDRITIYVAKDNLHLLKGLTDSRVIIKRLIFSNKSLILRTIWAQVFLPAALILDQIDILFCIGNISPIINIRKKTQWIHTIGPLESNFVAFFSWGKKLVLIISRYLITFSSYTSDVVFFESNYTKNIFVNKYKQKIAKSFVFHPGKNNYYYPVKTTNITNTKRYSDVEFILTVSHLYPYKNIELLLKSYSNLQLHRKGLYLFVAGSFLDDRYCEKLISLARKYEISKNVIFLGQVKKQDLRELYSRCKIFVFTSPFENFAYTLVEAMSCAAPIIATNTTAMPETCGSAALYYSPDSEQELSDCLLAYLNDENKRIEFKKKSLIKSTEYESYAIINKKTNQVLSRLVQNN